jgi:hypothetical protein
MGYVEVDETVSSPSRPGVVMDMLEEQNKISHV